MAAGRIEIYKRVTEQVGAREEERDPVLHYRTWCDVTDLYGEELYNALNIKLSNTAVFEVRYCKKIAELRKRLKDFFIVYDGDRYRVYATDFRRGEKKIVQLKCERIS